MYSCTNQSFIYFVTVYFFLNFVENCAEEVPEFDRTWEEKSKNLPQWNLNRPHTIGSAHGSMSPPLRGALENLNIVPERKRLCK